MKLTIGSDVEYNLKRDGRIVSAIPALPGLSKENRLSLGDGITVFPDNVNVEFTVKPAESPEELVSNFKEMSKVGTDFIKSVDHEIVIKASHTFSKAQLQEEGSNRFGCSTELVAYPTERSMLTVLEPPNLNEIGNVRSAGGHIHVGRKDYKTCSDSDFLIDLESKLLAARAVDYFLGLPFTFLDNDPTSQQRKKLYGLAGSMRENLPYGFEYRTLSNFWTSRPEYVELAFQLIDFAVNYAANHPKELSHDNNLFNFQAVANAINTGNKHECWGIFRDSIAPPALISKVLVYYHGFPYTSTFKY